MKDANGSYLDISPAPATCVDAGKRCLRPAPPPMPRSSLSRCRLLPLQISCRMALPQWMSPLLAQSGHPAEELDKALPPFDAAISRLGLMLFPSPSSSLKATQRMLKPGARFAALVFTTPDRNPFM